MRAVGWLNLRRLWRQPLRPALAVVAVAAGVSLFVAVAVEAHSSAAALGAFSRRLAGPTPLRVVGATSRAGLLQTETDVVARVPGVGSAVPVVEAVTLAEGRGGRKVSVVALGVDCRVEALVGPFGCSPAAVAQARDDAPPVVSASLLRALGLGAVVRTDTGRVPLDGALGVPQLDGFNEGRVAVFPLPVAQRRLGHPGRLDAIYIRPNQGTNIAALRARLSAALGPQDAVLSATDPPSGPDVASLLMPLFGIVSVVALGVAALLIFNIVALSLAERRRELAIGAALGAEDTLVVGGVLSEAAILGLFGGVVGIGLGLVVARPLVGSVSTISERFFGVRVAVQVAPVTAAEGLALGLAVALAAAAVPAWRATRRDVSAELQGRAKLADAGRRPTGWRAAAAMGSGVIGIALSELARRGGGLSAWQVPVGLGGIALAGVGFLLVFALLTPVVLQAIERTRLARRGSVRVALANLARDPRRTAAMAAAVGAAVAMSVILTSVVSAMRDISTGLTGGSAASRGVAVNTLPFTDSTQIQALMSPSDVAGLSQVPGVARVNLLEYLEAGHDGANQLVAVQANDEQTFPYRVVRGRAGRKAFAQGEVMVGITLARARHLQPGSELVLPAPTGLVHLRVGGIWQDPDNLGHNVTVPLGVMARIWGLPPPAYVVAEPVAGVSADQLARRISAAGIDPDLRVATPPELAGQITASLSTYLTPGWVLQRGMLLVTFIAVLCTLLLIGVQRRRELGLLAALGMAPDSLAATALIEAGAVGLVASVLGALAALGIFEAGRDFGLFGFGVLPPFRINLAVSSAYAALGVTVVLVGALLPAWRTSQLPVMDALRYE